MLAKEYKENIEINYPVMVSEKLDGYRCGWIDGKAISRQGKAFNIPEWFKYCMPDKNTYLDGELFAGRDNFQSMGVVRKKVPIDEEWMEIQYVLYDIPSIELPFAKRYKILLEYGKKVDEIWKKYRMTLDPIFHKLKCPVIVLKQHVVNSFDYLQTFYKNIVEKKGEGIMIKYPDSDYVGGRSNLLLKYKPVYDSEAVIIDYNPGTNKYKGLLGSFVCRPIINSDDVHTLDENDNHIFSMSGMNDDIRKNYMETHPIGTIITYKYNDVTKLGKPRFASYVRIRDDIKITINKKKITSSLEIRNVIINVFKKISDYYKFNGNTIKSKSYLNGITALKQISDDSELTEENVSQLKGIGPSLLSKVMEIIKTGHCEFLDSLEKDNPKEILQKIYGVGPKKADELIKGGFDTIKALRKSKNIDELLNEKQLIGLKYYEDINTRIPRAEIVQHEMLLKDIFKQIDPDGELTIAGSYRRGKPDSGDIDVLVKSENKKNFTSFINSLIEEDYITETLAKGHKKFMGLSILGDELSILGDDMCHRRIDIMYTSPTEYPFAILYFTGSKEFNLKMRQHANSVGYKLNEFTVEEYSDDPTAITSTIDPNDIDLITEEDIFDLLDYEYVEPTER